MKLITQTEMARELGVVVGTLRGWIVRGVVPPPSEIRLKRKYYRDDQIDEFKGLVANIVHHVAVAYSTLRAQGLFSCLAAAKYLGMPAITFTSWILLGRIQRPIHVKGRNRFYVQAELDKIRNDNEPYFRIRGIKLAS